MLRTFLAPAKSFIWLLLWAHTPTIANTIIVDDSETNRIVFGEGWIECPGNAMCWPAEGVAEVYNHSWHQYVQATSSN